MLDFLLTAILTAIIGLWYTGNLKISIPPNSIIYSILLYFTRELKYSHSGSSIRVDVNSSRFFLPYSRNWIGVKIGLYYNNGDFVNCNLPDGAVFTLTANEIGVSKIVLDKCGKKFSFIEDEVPRIDNEVEEL